MSIATVVTRGFGSFGRTQATARRGYAAYVALAEPPVDQQYIDADVSGGLPALSLLRGATPPAITGDVLVTPLINDRGYTITLSANGGFSTNAGGDTSRQYFQYYLLRSVDGSLDGPADCYVNDQAPTFTTDPVFFVGRNQSISPIDLAGLFPDPEAEAVAVAAPSGFPGASNTLAIVGNFVTGNSADEDRIDSIDLLATDPAENQTPGSMTLVTGRVTVPLVRSFDFDAAEAVLTGSYLGFEVGDGIFSPDVGLGDVAAQDPAADTLVDPNTIVRLLPSLGIVVQVLNLQSSPIRRQKRNTWREDQEAEDRERLRTELLAATAASAAAEQMRAEAQKNAAKQIRIQTVLPAKFRGRR